MVADRSPAGSVISNLPLWSCCILAAINIVAAFIEWPQFQMYLVFLILWWFELVLSCLAFIIILLARLPGWRTTVVCLVVSAIFITANTAAVQILMP